jgi:HrpA-like RNA helicase
VDIFYLKQPTDNYVHAAIDTVINIHKTEPAGDVLVFLTGSEEVDDTVELIRQRAAEYVSPPCASVWSVTHPDFSGLGPLILSQEAHAAFRFCPSTRDCLVRSR